jgi:hypothetical protein
MVCCPQAQVRCKRLPLGDDPLNVFCCTWTLAFARSLMLLSLDAPKNSLLNGIFYDASFSLHFDCVAKTALSMHCETLCEPADTIHRTILVALAF